MGSESWRDYFRICPMLIIFVHTHRIQDECSTTFAFAFLGWDAERKQLQYKIHEAWILSRHLESWLTHIRHSKSFSCWTVSWCLVLSSLTTYQVFSTQSSRGRDIIKVLKIVLHWNMTLWKSNWLQTAGVSRIVKKLADEIMESEILSW